jgi:hypothetical protein
VCHSVYVTVAWRNYIDSTASIGQIPTSFRHTGPSLFQALSSFCHMTNTIITDGLIDFYATQFISGMVMSHDVFEQESNELIRTFILSTTQAFKRSLDMIRDVTHVNGLTSGVTTNIRFTVKPILGSSNKIDYSIEAHWNVLSDMSSNCSCADMPLCTVHAYVDDDGLFRVPGILRGCYIVEALRQSSLICFYNQSCIDDLRHTLNSILALNTTALDSTMSSRYESNSTIDDIIAHLMVE